MSDTLDIETSWVGDGKLQVTVRNGQVQFVDKIDPASSFARRRMLKLLREQIPAVDTTALEQHIQQQIDAPRKAPEVPAEDDPSKPGDAALEKMDDDVRAEAKAMLLDPELLRRVLYDIADLGVVGEQQLALTAFLLAVSRLLKKPFSAVTQGVSSTGKSFVPDKIADLIPPEAKLVAHSLTPNALQYMPPGSLRHRAVFAGERSRVDDDERAEATRGLREMLASGRLCKALPIKLESGGFETKLVEQEGPIAFIESTTSATIFAEDSNRLLLLASDDSAPQTRRILEAVGQRYAHPAVDGDIERIIARHHAAQRMLRRVIVRIPFAPALAAAIPDGRPEARRAVDQTMAVVQAVALLFQFQRHPDPQHGTVIDATVEDYRTARNLLLEPLGRSLGSGLPGGVASFAEWIRSVVVPEVIFTTAELLTKPGIRWVQSTTYEYVKALRAAGILVVAGTDGKANRYKLAGADRVGGAVWLPEPDAIEGGSA